MIQYAFLHCNWYYNITILSHQHKVFFHRVRCHGDYHVHFHLGLLPTVCNCQHNTIFGRSEGFYDNSTVAFAALHGVIGIDWANHYGLPMHREDTLAQQATIIKTG